MGRRETRRADCEGEIPRPGDPRDPAACDPSDGAAAIGADIGDGRILAAEEELT